MTEMASDAGGKSQGTLGTVVGRLSANEFCFRADAGWTLSVQAPRQLASGLNVGQRAEVGIDEAGRAGFLGQASASRTRGSRQRVNKSADGPRICVTCVTRTSGEEPWDRIESIGGVSQSRSRWKLPHSEAIARVEQGIFGVYLDRGGDPLDVVIAELDGHKYLSTNADECQPASLLALPDCP